MTSKVHHISAPELRALFQAYQTGHWDFNSEEERIIRLVANALGKNKTLDLKGDDWEVFKSLKVKTLGYSPLIETFEDTIGIPSRRVKPAITEVLYQPASLIYLLTPWLGAPRTEILKELQFLRSDEKKLLLKALAHFSVTDRAMLLDHKEGIVLYAMTKRLQEISKGKRYSEEIPEEVQDTAQKFFGSFYSELRGIALSSKEIEKISTANAYINNAVETLPEVKRILDEASNWGENGEWLGSKEDEKTLNQILEIRSSNRQEVQTAYEKELIMETAEHGMHFPGPLKVNPKKRNELLSKGEERVHREILHDLGKLLSAWDRLKTSGQEDLVTEDIFNSQLQLEKVKLYALVDYYKPHVRDPHFSLLYAKALMDLDRVLRVEEEFLSFIKASLESVVIEREALALNVDYFLERAWLMGETKAGILQSQFLRETKRWDLPEGEFYYRKALENLHLDDSEAQIEAAAVHALAWKNKINEISDRDVMDLLKPFGRRGGEVLADLFYAGSSDAANEILSLTAKKLTREYVQKYYLERFLSAIVAFFSLGYVDLEKLKEGTFFARHPYQFSKREVDFLISASLAGVPKAKETLQKVVGKGFGPKYRLQQAKDFLESLEGPIEKMDPYLPVNGSDAYRYLEDVAKFHLRRRKLGIEPPKEFIELLEKYVEQLAEETYPYHALYTLYMKLSGGSPPLFSIEEDLSSGSLTPKEPPIVAVEEENQVVLHGLDTAPAKEDEPVDLILDFGGNRFPVRTAYLNITPMQQMMHLLNPAPGRRFASEPEDFLNLLRYVNRFMPRRTVGPRLLGQFQQPAVSETVATHLLLTGRADRAFDYATRNPGIREFLSECYERLPNGTVALTAAGAAVVALTYALSNGGTAAGAAAQAVVQAIEQPQMETAIVTADYGQALSLTRTVLRYGPQAALTALRFLAHRGRF